MHELPGTPSRPGEPISPGYPDILEIPGGPGSPSCPGMPKGPWIPAKKRGNNQYCKENGHFQLERLTFHQLQRIVFSKWKHL